MISLPDLKKSRNGRVTALNIGSLKNTLELQGYFPEANIIPPFFAIEQLPSGVTSRQTSHPLTHFVTKSSRQWRDFKITHPENYTDTVDLITSNYTVIKKIYKKSNRLFSYSLPTTFDTPAKRSGKQISGWHTLQQQLLSVSSRKRLPILVQVDIQNCYHILYTHSIEWAFKSIGQGGIGNNLDTSIRRGNDNRTHGIPVGQYTSDILAEVVLSWIDSNIEKSLSHVSCVGFRFKDNYYFLCKDTADGERVLSSVASELRKAHCTVNDSKTEVTTFAEYYSARWQSDYDLLLESLQLTDGSLCFTNRKLKVFIEQVINLSVKYNNEKSILEKAIALLTDSTFVGYINHKWLLFAVANMLPLRSPSYPKLMTFMKKIALDNPTVKADYEEFMASEIEGAAKRNDLFALLWVGYLLHDTSATVLKTKLLAELNRHIVDNPLAEAAVKYLNNDHSDPILWASNSSRLKIKHANYLNVDELDSYLGVSFGES